MDQNQFKESGCSDVDEAKFKQTVSVWTPKKVREHTLYSSEHLRWQKLPLLLVFITKMLLVVFINQQSSISGNSGFVIAEKTSIEMTIKSQLHIT